MKFACAECGARYQIADEKLSPRGVKVRCKKCGHVNKLKPEPATTTTPAGDGVESKPPAVETSSPGALGSGELPEFATNEIPDFGPSEEAESTERETVLSEPGASADAGSGFSIDVEGPPSVEDEEGDAELGDVVGVDLKASAELSFLQDALRSELDDAPVPLPPAPQDGPASSASEPPVSAEASKPRSDANAATADLSTDTGIESEIGSAFEAMFSAEGLAADHAPIVQAASEPEPEPEPAASEPAIPKDAVWYVAVRDEQLGPLTLDELQQYWTEKRIGPRSLCWKQGMTDWLPMVAVDELQAFPGMNAESPDDDASYEGLPNLRPPSELVPAPAPRAASEVDWKPTAASALASLAAEEMADAPASTPRTGPGTPTSASESSAAAGLLAAAAPTGPIEPVAAAAGPMSVSSGPTVVPPAPAPVPASLPAAAPVRPRPPAWLIGVAAGAVLVLLLGAGGFFFIRGGGGFGAGEPSAPVAALNPDLGETTPDAGAAAVAPDAGAADGGVERPDLGPPDAAATAVAEADKEEPKAKPKPRRRTARRSSRRSSSPPRRPDPSPPRRTDVDDLLSGATGGEASESGLPSKPDDGDVFNAIRQHGGEVRGCVAEQLREDPSLEGRMQVKLRVAGTGKVMSVAISPTQFRDAPVGRCIRRSAKSWRFPRFSGPPFPVEFPVPVQ